MTNIYEALREPESVSIKSVDELIQIVRQHDPKTIILIWESVSKKGVLVKHRIREVVGTRQTKDGRQLITIKKSRRQFRSLYAENIKDVLVDA